jgi:site-specific DNA-cytosine methylase
MSVTPLEEVGFAADVHMMAADSYAVPQRRNRLFIFGQRQASFQNFPPPQITNWRRGELALQMTPPTVADAISDLPELIPGQDGSTLLYRQMTATPYQNLMRGMDTPNNYLTRFGELTGVA